MAQRGGRRHQETEGWVHSKTNYRVQRGMVNLSLILSTIYILGDSFWGADHSSRHLYAIGPVGVIQTAASECKRSVC